MKKNILIILLTAFLGITLYAQNDTLYIIKNGTISARYNVNTQIDSIIFYKPIPTSGTFTDYRDGNTYNWVKIGNQIWMAENLKYLPSVVGPDSYSETSPHYYVYDYNGTIVADAKATDNYNTYGVLYNLPSAMAGFPYTYTYANPSGVQGVCPSGWHLPSYDEFLELIYYLGSVSEAGGKAKSTTLWQSPNEGATNESGFSALPSGYYSYSYFNAKNLFTYWWTTTVFDSYPTYGVACYTQYSTSIMAFQLNPKTAGFSVRCVKD